jgi:FkbM family methyltransferase
VQVEGSGRLQYGSPSYRQRGVVCAAGVSGAVRGIGTRQALSPEKRGQMMDAGRLRRRISDLFQSPAKRAAPPTPGAQTVTRRDHTSGISSGRFGGFDVAYRKGTADEQVIKHSFDRDIFFAGVPEYVPGENDVIIDVGAHIGTFSLLAASKATSGSVHAIEASRDSFELLKINAALNRLDNLRCHHLAISDTDGMMQLYHDAENWGHSTVHDYDGPAEAVACRTLRSFLDEQGIAECRFMKLNCEGAEFPILLSADRDTLRRFEMMLVLYHCDLWERNSEEELTRHLSDCGFRCDLRNVKPKRGWIVATRT